MLCRQLQANAIATRQLKRRALALGVIDRSNGVNDVLPVIRHELATRLGNVHDRH